MKREKSCGMILYYKGEKGIEYLLLHHPQGHFSFPKGHIEKNDKNDQETAIRELEEETGIKDAIFEKKFKTYIKYSFKHENQTIFKIVYFYLARTKTKKVKLSHEHVDFIWLTYDEAYKKATFENTKKILKKANEYLT